MTITLPQLHQIGAGETRNVAIDLKSELDSGELLTGAPTITEQVTTDLTLSNKSVNTAQITVNDRTVAIGEAVQFSVTGQNDGTDYAILISVGTDSTPAQTIEVIARLCCD